MSPPARLPPAGRGQPGHRGRADAVTGAKGDVAGDVAGARNIADSEWMRLSEAGRERLAAAPGGARAANCAARCHSAAVRALSKH